MMAGMERLVALVEVAPLLRALTPNGQPPSARTLYRWTYKGKAGVRLWAVRRRGEMWTTLAAVRAFHDEAARREQKSGDVVSSGSTVCDHSRMSPKPYAGGHTPG